MNTTTFVNAVHGQIEMLRSGKPLEAIDQYFAVDGVMFANGELFAQGAKDVRQRQEPYIAPSRKIVGNIVDVKIDENAEICVFRNRTRFTDSDGMEHQIDGLCWQKWSDNKIAEEQYFQGDIMNDLISGGLLENPGMLKPKLVPEC